MDVKKRSICFLWGEQMNKEKIIAYLVSHKEEFKEKYGVTRIGFFGSYVRGTHTENSDIDIAVGVQIEWSSILPGAVNISGEEGAGLFQPIDEGPVTRIVGQKVRIDAQRRVFVSGFRIIVVAV